MVLGHSIGQCAFCPQRYNCGIYMKQSSGIANNYQINNNINNGNKVEDYSIIRSSSKSTSNDILNNQQITTLFSSIENSLNKTNQELSNQNIMLQEEIAQIKQELENMKQKKQTYSELNLEAKLDNMNDSNIEDTNIKEVNAEILNEEQVQEKGLELYNQNNSTVFREKKTIFGTKRWVEEKK